MGLPLEGIKVGKKRFALDLEVEEAVDVSLGWGDHSMTHHHVGVDRRRAQAARPPWPHQVLPLRRPPTLLGSYRKELP